MSVKTRKASSPPIALRRAVQRRIPLLCQAGSALGAFLAAGAPLFGGLHPLGLCVAAGVAPGYTLCAAAGACLGYLRATVAVDAAPYLVAVVSVALLRLLGGAARYEDAPLAPAGAGAVCLCLLRCGLGLAAGQGVALVLQAAAEALLVLGVAYWLTAFFAAPRRTLSAQDTEAKAAACIALMTALACLTPYRIAGASLAHIAGALAVLITARRQGSAPATLPGVATAVVLAAADPTSAYAGLGIAAGGLAAGLFCPEGRTLSALTFCGAGFLGVLCAPTAQAGLCLMAELCTAALCFTLLPAAWLATVPTTAGAPAARAACATLAGRLERLSQALQGVGSTVQQICDRLPPKTESTAELCDAVAQQCCAVCPKNTVCWVECSTDTYDCFNQLAPLLHSAKAIGIADLPPTLLRRCSAPARLAACITHVAARQAARRGLVCRSRTTRGALCEQYAALAATLGTLAYQVAMEELPCPRKARRLHQTLRDMGLEPLDTSVARDACGRLRGTVLLPPLTFERPELAALAREVSALFCQPVEVRCRQEGTVTTLLFAQQPAYRAIFGIAGLPAQGDISADAVQTLTQDGQAHAVLCDGMGTGKAAAVDGKIAATLAAQLLGAGFGPAETARLVNVALTLKSDDEAATTLDTASVDLFTGEVRLFKAGAAPSFLVHGGTVSAHGLSSVPIGILSQVLGDECRLTLTPQDTLVLVSDGALALGAPWLSAQLARHADKPPQALAQAVATAARAAAPRPDDITVAALRLAPV